MTRRSGLVYLGNSPELDAEFKAELKRAKRRRYMREYMRDWKAQNAERKREIDRQSYARLHVPKPRPRLSAEQKKARAAQRRATPVATESRRRYRLRAKYGLTPACYDKLLAEQGHRCAICGVACFIVDRMVVDHCHSTKKVRGLLCDKCNTALGLFQDNAASVERAAEYLRRHK